MNNYNQSLSHTVVGKAGLSVRLMVKRSVLMTRNYAFRLSVVS